MSVVNPNIYSRVERLEQITDQTTSSIKQLSEVVREQHQNTSASSHNTALKVAGTVAGVFALGALSETAGAVAFVGVGAYAATRVVQEKCTIL